MVCVAKEKFLPINPFNLLVEYIIDLHGSAIYTYIMLQSQVVHVDTN